jgi:molybdopterin synthase sulfur carrier subunit
VTRVVIPSHLRSYTGCNEVTVEGETVGAVLVALEQRFPGLAIRVVDEQERIRPHIKFFVNGEQVHDLDAPATGDMHILAALSGG